MRAFVSVSIDCFYEQLAQSRDYLTRTRSMSEITPIVLRLVDLTIDQISHLR